MEYHRTGVAPPGLQLIEWNIPIPEVATTESLTGSDEFFRDTITTIEDIQEQKTDQEEEEKEEMKGVDLA